MTTHQPEQDDGYRCPCGDLTHPTLTAASYCCLTEDDE